MQLSYQQSAVLLALGGTGVYSGAMKRFCTVMDILAEESAFFEKEGIVIRLFRKVFSREAPMEMKVDKRLVYYALIDLHQLGLVDIKAIRTQQGDDHIDNYAYYLTQKGRMARDQVIPFVDASRKRQDYGRVFEVED